MARIEETFCPECLKPMSVVKGGGANRTARRKCMECLKKEGSEKKKAKDAEFDFHKKHFFARFDGMTPQEKTEWVLDWICRQEFASIQPKKPKKHRHGPPVFGSKS